MKYKMRKAGIFVGKWIKNFSNPTNATAVQYYGNSPFIRGHLFQCPISRVWIAHAYVLIGEPKIIYTGVSNIEHEMKHEIVKACHTAFMHLNVCIPNYKAFEEKFTRYAESFIRGEPIEYSQEDIAEIRLSYDYYIEYMDNLKKYNKK